jgi:RNA polymerase sigma factor (sigma-70 family)
MVDPSVRKPPADGPRADGNADCESPARAGERQADLDTAQMLAAARSGSLSSGLSPSGVVVDHEQGARIEEAVAQLPDDYRRVIDLRVRQSLSYHEVGQAMDRTAEAARKLFVRAVDELRSRIWSDDQSADQR